ncbi:hypothetical protein BJ165DRAFT_735609 [Panaeolus papilionaceus]|nr:hypothetical protein BJ165DRAFT_735609 [Panaeolus papilionaceus]
MFELYFALYCVDALLTCFITPIPKYSRETNERPPARQGKVFKLFHPDSNLPATVASYILPSEVTELKCALTSPSVASLHLGSHPISWQMPPCVLTLTSSVCICPAYPQRRSLESYFLASYVSPSSHGTTSFCNYDRWLSDPGEKKLIILCHPDHELPKTRLQRVSLIFSLTASPTSAKLNRPAQQVQTNGSSEYGQ